MEVVYWDHHVYWNIGLSHVQQNERQVAAEMSKDQDNLISIYFLYLFKNFGQVPILEDKQNER